ncbi:alanyl-tRNA editing protein [Acinetobacter sp. WU_MDCI_Abxe161]|uniref:alanyl-tRNA editing protein n=1 Tax=Acinetobacter sp. WU_MDCI_Abxe161 TaxID=2850074 RepID=UPI0021CD6BB3|nr:alanyl-tRNA editing protein [Acinetobacter sp. WU_MDCI_Abxe161]MCU4504482.1 alanyl-tRNA editing protein [Acinetobacter sp. WU_MDCI_Abxe161]
MTQALYLTGVLAAEVEVLECKSCEDGRFAICLSATPFHPQGGGQPSDTGKIAEVNVVHVAIEQGEIIHYCTHPVDLGKTLAQVDEKKRHYHSRLHSAGHLIAHVMHLFGWQAIKAQHWPNDARVQFIPLEAAEQLDAEMLQNQCSHYIQDGLPPHFHQHADGFREISFGEFPAFPCGGTHVTSLADIGSIDIHSYQFKKGKLSVSYGVAEETE